MPEFYLVVTVFLVLAACFIVFPIMLNRSTADQGRSAINVSLFKQRLGELEAERVSHGIDEQEFQRLKLELERRLLDETANDQPSERLEGRVGNLSIKLRLAIFCIVPIAAYLIYQQIGAQADWEIANTLKQVQQESAAGNDAKVEIKKLLSQLLARLDQQPENPEYLMTVASAQMELENYPAASEAYQRLVAIFPEDPRLLGSYAQALYLSSGRKLNPQVTSIANKALSIDPQQTGVLSMLGMASFEARDYNSAVTYWSKLVALLGPDSSNRQMITRGIEQAKILMMANGGAVPVDSQEGVLGSSAAESDVPAVVVRVSIDPSLNADPNATVFVFARAVVGPPMPLAVAKLRVSDLPATVRLDDSMAMAPSLKLSSFEKVNIVARVSKKGTAIRGSGDIEGEFGPLNVALNKDVVSVIIEKMIP
ncbi:MAG: cytochrome c-type biogenesis protein CcmH [Oceanicoccus sp.]|jgi:cytochrome c-type biogenesis protein CcmH